MAEEKKKVQRNATRQTARTRAKETAPQKLKLLITVVNRDKAEFYTDYLQSFSVNLQFAAKGKGTANSELLALLGLGENTKAVLFSLVREDQAEAALAGLREKFATIRNGAGIACTIPLTSMIGVSVYRFLCDNRAGIKEEVSDEI